MARPTPFSALPAVVLILAVASSALARPGRVITPDGKRLEGDVTENPADQTVEVVSEGKRYKFNASALRGPVEYDDSIQVQPPAGRPQPGQRPPQRGPAMSTEEEFAKRRAALAPSDAAGRIRLARWAFEREEYDLARDVAQEAVTIDRRSQEAQEMLRTIDAQRRLNRKTGPGQQQPGGRPSAPGAPAGQRDSGDQGPDRPRAPRAGGNGGGNRLVPPLSPDEVNRVRMLEWHGERNVRVRLLNDVKRRYLAGTNIRPGDFNRLNAIDQAWEMKQKGSPDLLNDIRLTNDPPTMQEYRTLVQRTVLSGCATTACHGGGAGSERFALHPRADQESEAYANFITLNNYQYEPEKGPEASMIDRNRPEDSLLIQFGLPQDVANFPHPDVPGFRPLYRNRNEQNYRNVVRWIADSLTPLQDDYDVPFDAQNDRERDARPAAGNDPQQPGEQPVNQPGDQPGNQPGAGDVAPGQRPVGRAPPAQRGPAGGGAGNRPPPAPPQRPAPGPR